MLWITKHWYRATHSFFSFVLLPLSLLFGVLVSVRRALYRLGLKKIYQAPVPVIVVGNITVGGTGKTPLVIWLAKMLRAQGFKPGIVSRGYGGQTSHQPRIVDLQSDVVNVGDEALLLVNGAQCPVVIGIDRVAAVKKLLTNNDCDIVISDDGLQHYRLGRHIEIAIVDGMRRFGNASLLPAGPLREPVSRLQHVDFVITQSPAHANEYVMKLQGTEVVAVNDVTQKQSLTSFTTVHAVAGIGHPERFFAKLRSEGLTVIEHVFPDHYRYQAGDLDFNDERPVIMTEKDAVKCVRFVTNRHWYLPVMAEVDEAFTKKLLQKLGEITCATN